MRIHGKALFWSLALGLALAGVVANAGTDPSVAASASAHDCVVIVLDASGSMGDSMGNGQGRKIDAAKFALKTVLAAVPKTTYVGLLVFSSSGANGWVQELGPRDDRRLNAAIDAIHAFHGTPLAQHLKIGADRLLKEREQQLGYGSYRLLVVTDGEETDDKSAIEAYPPDIRRRGIVLDVIGVKMARKHTLEQYATSYRRADDPASLEQAIRAVLAEVPNRDDDTSDDAFALLDGLEPEVATAMIAALGRTGNQPIGVAAAAPLPLEQADADGGAAVSASPAGSAPAQSGKNKIPPALLVVALVVVAIILGLALLSSMSD